MVAVDVEVQAVETDSGLQIRLPGKKPRGFSAFLLRRTPIPFLIQNFLEVQVNRKGEFIEEGRLPDRVLRTLSEYGLPGSEPESFFLDDRRNYRLGLLTLNNHGHQHIHHERQVHLFCEGLERWLSIAGRTVDQDFRIIPVFHLEDLYPHRFVHFIPVAAIVWRAESPWLEQWLGRSHIIRLPGTSVIRCSGNAQNEQHTYIAGGDRGGEPAETPSTKTDTQSHSHRLEKVPAPVADNTQAILKESHGSVAGNNGQTVYRNGNGHKPALQAEQATVVSVPDSFAGKALDASQRQIATESGLSELSISELNRSDQGAYKSDPISYCVAGTSRGRPARRYFLKKETNRIRLALLSAPELAARTQLAFFDRMQTRPHPVREHRDMLRSGLIRTDHASLSLEMKTNGEFVGLTSGLSLLIWRAAQKRAVLISSQSTEEHPERRVRGLRGQLHPGDMLLMLPGRLTGAEWREISDLIKSSGNRDPLNVLQDRLGTWLDYRNLGRALLLRQNSD